MPNNDGDVLSNVSVDGRASTTTESKFYQDAIESVVGKRLDSLNDDIGELLNEIKVLNKSNAKSKVFDYKQQRYSSENKFFGGKHNFKSSSRGGNSVFDSIFDGILKSAGIQDTDITDHINKIVEDISDDLGVKTSEIYKAFGEELPEVIAEKIDKKLNTKNNIFSKLTKKTVGWFTSGFDEFNKGIFESFNSKKTVGDRRKELEEAANVSDDDIRNQVREAEEKNKLIREHNAKFSDDQLEEIDVKKLGKDAYKKRDKARKDLHDFNVENVNRKDHESLNADVSSVIGKFKNDTTQIGKNFVKDATSGGISKESIKGAAKTAIPELGKAAGTAAKGILSVAKAAGPQAAAMLALDLATQGVQKRFGEAVESFSRYSEASEKALDRFTQSRRQNLKDQEARYQADVESMIMEPFNILKDAATSVQDVWDSVLKNINATQGYDKSALQDLMSAYSSRLKSEGLDKVIGSTDITSMLSEIISAGLSGEVAEEFAYQATLLNNAIPTENFESYAQSYASLVSSAMQAGMSQSAAISYANDQLNSFANSVLYASREVSGGLTTSLTGVSSLFSDVVDIAKTGKIQDISGISSAITIVQAIAGQVSSELGNELTDKIMELATGGNDDSLVALRSLADVGASNTAFLKMLVDDPNTVLARMFKNLSSKLSQSSDNYMEVAYGLADTFGISAQALTEIDWNKLENALLNDNGSNALSQNLSLLASGETTTSAESQRLEQINQYMIDEGLSYVLDNEVARAIQEHMWQQEIANELMESSYAVELEGSAMEMLESIQGLVNSVLNALNPLSWLQSGMNLIATKVEAGNLYDDLAKLVEVGKVGNGNESAYHDLTTYEVESLSKPKNILELWGATSSYYSTKSAMNTFNNTVGKLANLTTTIVDSTVSYRNENFAKNRNKRNGTTFGGSGEATSMYNWAGSVGKSADTLLNAVSNSSDWSLISGSNANSRSNSGVQQTIDNDTSERLQSFLDTMEDYVNDNKSFDEWYSSAASYGFSNVEETLKNYDMTTQNLKDEYQSINAKNSSEYEYKRDEEEDKFWLSGETFWETTFPDDFNLWVDKYDTTETQWRDLYTQTMSDYILHLDEKYDDWKTIYDESVKSMITSVTDFDSHFTKNFTNKFLKEWTNYYIGTHTNYYNNLNTKSSELSKAVQDERSKTGESVLSLAKAISGAASDFTDPQVQANALLAQILIVLESMMQANNSSSGGLTLPTALSALGLNLTGISNGVSTAVSNATNAASSIASSVGSGVVSALGSSAKSQ